MRDHLGIFNLSADLQFARGVLLLDDCEGSCTWIVTGTDANVTATFAAAAAFTGATGLQLFSGDADPAEDDNVFAYKFFSYPESGLMVARVRIAKTSDTAHKALYLQLRWADGTTLYIAQLKYTPADGKVYYADAAGAAQEIPDLQARTLSYQFVTWELVVDTRDNVYLSTTINGLHADLTDLPVWPSGAMTSRYGSIAIAGTCAGAAPCTLYADAIYVGEFLDV